MKSALTIGPKTKVGPLLDAYPALESTLIEMAPAFEKLRNPMLRRTIAQVTTLATAAKVGGIPIAKMVQTLRQAAGMDPAREEGVSEEVDELTAQPDMSTQLYEPSWVTETRVVETIDVDVLLASDQTPLAVVLPKLARLPRTEALLIHSSFRPEPLVEALRKKGYPVVCKPHGEAFDTLVGGKEETQGALISD